MMQSTSLICLANYIRQVTIVTNGKYFPSTALAQLDQTCFPGCEVWVIMPRPFLASTEQNDAQLASDLSRLIKAAFRNHSDLPLHEAIALAKTQLALLTSHEDESDIGCGKSLANRFELVTRYAKLAPAP